MAVEGVSVECRVCVLGRDSAKTCNLFNVQQTIKLLIAKHFEKFSGATNINKQTKNKSKQAVVFVL